MACKVPQGLKFVEGVVRFGKLIFDSRSGRSIRTLFGATNGTIVPKGAAATFIVDLPDGRLLLGFTTKFNEAPDGSYSRDDGALIAFSQHPGQIYRPTSAHSHDVYRSSGDSFSSLAVVEAV